MIIDMILDRAQGTAYNAKQFYLDCMEYGADSITRAMDSGKEYATKKALVRYIVDNDYNLDIIAYINSVYWTDDREADPVMDKLIDSVQNNKCIGVIDSALRKARTELTSPKLLELLAIAKINGFCGFEYTY